MAYFNNLIGVISKFYPTLRWKVPVKDKIIYLTFDDGPVPQVTDFVLSELKKYSAKATFFCVGDNIQKHNVHFLKILKEGHSFGNHTYNHHKGWATDDETYFKNVQYCQDIINELITDYPLPSTHRNLFRPPYGKIKKSQIKELEKKYLIVMWSVLTGDFDQAQSPEDCLQEAIKHTQKGSIVIFHDSIKAEKNLQYALPLYLKHFTSKGYRFEKL